MIINGGEKYHDVCDHPERFATSVGPHPIPKMTKAQCKVDEVQPDRTGNAAIYFVKNKKFDKIKDAEKDLAKSAEKQWTQDSADKIAIDKLRVELFTFTHTSASYYPMNGILVFRTRDGKHYAKLQIISYFKTGSGTDVTETKESMYYTFKYAYNASESTNLDTTSIPSSNEKEHHREHQLILNPL